MLLQAAMNSINNGWDKTSRKLARNWQKHLIFIVAPQSFSSVCVPIFIYSNPYLYLFIIIFKVKITKMNGYNNCINSITRLDQNEYLNK